MVDINIYRSRIGQFSPKNKTKKYLYKREYYEQFAWNENKSGKNLFLVLQFLVKAVLICLLLLPSNILYNTTSPALSDPSPVINHQSRSTNLLVSPLLKTTPDSDSARCSSTQPSQQYHRTDKKNSTNFIAKYTNGNRNESKGIRNFHLNIRSLNNKIYEVKNLVKQHTPTILGLSECELRKLNGQFDEDRLKVPGYTVLFPKSWNLHGFARVVVYVKNSFQYEQVADLEDDLVQSIWIKGGFKNGKRMYFCHGYREHTSTMGNSMSAQRSYLETFLAQWELATLHGNPTEPNETHICLDMNLDCLNDRWLKPDYHLVSLARLVQSACHVNNMTQLVAEVTRLQYNSTTQVTDISCIDHVYCNSKFRCSKVTVTSFGNSDHDMIGYVRYSKEPPSPARSIRKRSYKTFNKEKYLEDLSRVDWTPVYCCQEVDAATNVFTRMFCNVLNVHAPWIQFQQRKKFCPWLTEETKNLMKQRDIWKQRAKELALLGGIASLDQQQAWEEFKKYRNKINNRKKTEEKVYKSEKFEENLDSVQKTWQTAKLFMNWKSCGSPHQLEVDNRLVTKASSIAALMNTFFIDKVKNIRRIMMNLPICLSMCVQIMGQKECGLSLKHVTLDMVQKLLKNLKNSRSTSIDELDNYSVKLAADLIAQPLHHIITLSVLQKKFPSAWKYSKVIPLHKKGPVLERKNYRPVAILSPLSKILEKVIYNQIYNYFSNNKIFHPNLHGYRQNRSTQTALLQMYDRWVKSASQGQVSGVILLDLSAAFDLVDHQILLKKLKIYGLDDDYLAWIESYLTDRYQAVWIDHILSEFLHCEVGVPQGSNLGPLLFLIFYNDLPFSLQCDIDAYADDSTMSATGQTVTEISEKLTTSCELVVEWMNSNQFKLNASKTHLLTVGTEQRLKTLNNTVDVTMDGIKLKESDDKVELLLGCQIEPSLKWHIQVEELLKKLKKRIVGLSSLKFVVPFAVRKTLTLGIFNSVLVYCLPLFGGCDVAEIKQLQVLQNKAARIVTHSPPRSSREVMFNKLQWHTVNQLVAYHTLLAVHKIRQTGEPEYLASFLKFDNRSGRIIIPNTRLTLAKKSFVWRGSSSWNLLPNNLRNSNKIGYFKRGVKNWVTQNVPGFLD